MLQIEPTDRCNLSCSMCAPHHEAWAQVHAVPKGLMDLGRYETILRSLAAEDCRFDHVIFQWLGDPSLHPQLEDMLALAQDHLAGRVGYLRVDTNAIVLTPARMDRLVEVYARRPELPILFVCTLDAHSPETYHRVKGQDALARVRRNVRHLIMRRARLPLEDVRLNVQLQFVVQEGNHHELGAFVGYWSDLLRCHGGGRGYSEIMVKRLSVGAGGPGQLAADLLYEQATARDGIIEEDRGHVHVKVWQDRPWQSTAVTPGPRQPCPGLWVTPVVRHDGHLMMCCADLAGHLDLGPLHESSFRTLWGGALATSRRLAHIQGRFDEVGPCGSCGGIGWYTTTPEQIRETLIAAGREELWEGYAARTAV
ncbi:radical SAM protein [Myxococcota bacterium]|nr:radical SAM protein [Myxococcota bacterium]